MPSLTTPTVNGVLRRSEEPAENDDLLPSPPSIAACTTVEELRATLAHLNTRESAVTARLQSLLSTQSSLTHTLSRLDLIRAHLGTQVVGARSLSTNILSSAATTAARVSSAVKRLDTEQSRVKATLEVVEQVAELKQCVLGVTGSMGAPQDWETAANFLHRASKIPDEIVKGEFAEEMVPSAEVPDMPAVTLNNAAESLCALFLREFEKAAQSSDGEKVTRFFKLFPLIGRAQVGLDLYGRYVCGGVASRARAALAPGGDERGDFFYSTAMTRLFEHIATIVEHHGTLVDRHYGKGRMVKVVERLQVEADTQGGIIIDTFTDEREIDRKLTEVKSYAYSFLVQSFLPSARGPLGAAQRTGSPAPGGPAANRDAEDEGVDVKDIDLLLSEIGVMLSRWSLYCRFLARKFQDDGDGTLHLHPIILNSNLSIKIRDRLISPFNILTTFFCRRSVEKAFQLDEFPTDLSLNLSTPLPSNGPYITSAVDDVMYIVSKLLNRALETSQRALVGGVISTVGRVLGSDFIGMIQRKMRDECYPRSTSGVPGALPPDDRVLSFLILINNLDTASDYTHRIISLLLEGPDDLSSTFPFDSDAVYVRDQLKAMETSFDAKTSELISDGITAIFNNVVKPRLRPLLADAFRDIDYVVSESGSRDDDLNDPVEDPDLVRRRFEAGWEKLVKPHKRVLTEKTFHRLLSSTASYFAKLLEKRIWGCSGRINELGAIRLERDVSAIVGVVVRGGRYGVRDVFVRCTQICLVVNMDEEEVREVISGGEAGVEWKLELQERKRAREMLKAGAS